MNLSNLWSLGIAEFRSCRRSVGAWVIVAIACAVTWVHWSILAHRYAFSALGSPVDGLIGPRYTFPETSSTMILMFSIGIIFLASDIRSRDIRNRIRETLDSQPVWDLEAVIGRLMGVVMFLAACAVTMTIGIFAFGMLADTFSFPIGTSIEPFSVLAYLVWDIVPNLVLWGALAIFLTYLIKFRFLAVLVTLVFLGIVYVLGIVLPFSVSSVLSMHSGASMYPSELAPTFVTWIVLINRFLVVVLAGGFLALAALLQSRNQSTKAFIQHLLYGGLAILFVLSGVISYLIGSVSQGMSTVQNWTYAHKLKQSHSSTDIEQISGSIVIRPGRSIRLELILTMASAEAKNGWLFSLNPGYRITELAVNGNPSVDYTFEDGLLSVPSVDSREPPKVRIVASGKPDKRFAYLDSSLDWKELNAVGAKRLFLLGQESYIFHPSFVALMPGISWIPASGSAYGAGNLESRPRDFFLLDVEVSVPQDWLIAGPGSRDVLDSSTNFTYRLRTRNPIPEFALVSSRFVQRLIRVDGVEYEVLLNKKHTKNLHAYAESASWIREWLTGRSKHLQDIGLQYPYSRLSLVEVPPSLRTYGGGWRMDSVYSAPGIQMIRESGFPVAPFDQRYFWLRGYYGEEESAFHRDRFVHLVSYFADDLHGGDPLVGIPKNFVDYQTAPTGKGATALRYLVNELVLNLTTTNAGYFSVYSVLTRGSNVSTFKGVEIDSMFDTGTQSLLNWRAEFADHPSAWDLLEKTPLCLIDFHSDPTNAFHALMLKGQRVADAVIGNYGEEIVAEFLALLVNRFRGRFYTETDFNQTALDVGMDIEATVGDWLNQTGMAGFVVDHLRNERISNDEDGETRYQTSFVLSNRESVPGVVRVSYQSRGKTGYIGSPISLDSVHVEGNSAVRVAFRDDEPTQRLWLEPRLALNRNLIRLDFPELNDDNPTNSSVLPYVTPFEWEFSSSGEIIIDDLDEGFSIENPSQEFVGSSIPEWIEYVAAAPKPDLDKGLLVPNRREQFLGVADLINPLFAIISNLQQRERKFMWYRDGDPSSYGRYRRTYAGRSEGMGMSKAIFSISLPTAGLWRLDYHVPPAMRTNIPYNSMRSPYDWSVWRTEYELGTYTIQVSNDELQFEIEFDASTSTPGWNELGTFELSNSKVDVVLTGVSHGMAVADAIRWTPL